MKISGTLATLGVLSALTAIPARAQDTAPRPARPSLTVLDFETDRTGWMPPPHFGETLAELLTDRLVASGAYRMTDRVWLVSADERNGHIPFDVIRDHAESAGVDFLLAGSVTRLSSEKKSSTGGGLLPLPLVGGLLRRQKMESVIALTMRVIDVRTGEIVATATAESGAAKGSTSGGGVALVGKFPIIAGKGSSISGAQDGLLHQAMQQAIAAAAGQILAAAPRLAAR